MKNKKSTKAASSVNEALTGTEGTTQTHEPKHHKKPKKQYL